MAKQIEPAMAERIKAGLIAGVVGQYISDYISNLCGDNPEQFTLSGIDQYLAGMVTGFVGATMGPRLNLLAATVLSTGMYYMTAAAVRKELGQDNPPTDVFVRNLLRDAIIVYYLLYFQRLFISPFMEKAELSILGKTVLTGLLISIYYGLNDYIFNSENKTVYESKKK